MNKRELKRLDKELTNYLNSMTSGMGRLERRQSMRDYHASPDLHGTRNLRM